MTADHVHSDPEGPSTWSIGQLRRHLLYPHKVPAPVTWDIGELHQAHLAAHAGPVRADQTKESPVFTHDHNNDVPGFHARTDRRAVAYHLESAHGLTPEQIDVREVYSQHESLHSPQDPATDAERVERLAENLYNRDARGTGPDWDDLGQETRDQYRDRARTNLAAARDARIAGEVAAERAHQPNPSILVDRLICALTGIDFDRDWVPDNVMGSSGRGVIRRTWIQPAQRLLDWLERGGALYLPAVASLSADVATLQEQLTVTGHQLESTQRERDHLSRQLSAALLERNEASQRLEESKRQRQGLFEEMGELRQQLDTAVATRDKALEAGRLLENARDDALNRLDTAHQQRDAALEALNRWEAKESVSTDLNAMAPISSDQAVCSDELPQINQPFKGLTLEVPLGTNRLMLSFVQEPEPEDKPLAAEPS